MYIYVYMYVYIHTYVHILSVIYGADAALFEFMLGNHSHPTTVIPVRFVR